MSHDIDQNFTGSRMQHEPAEIVRASVPFRIVIKMVDNIKDGKIQQTYFEWEVQLRGDRIARSSFNLNETQPRTRKAAIRHAKQAIRAWCTYVEGLE